MAFIRPTTIGPSIGEAAGGGGRRVSSLDKDRIKAELRVFLEAINSTPSKSSCERFFHEIDVAETEGALHDTLKRIEDEVSLVLKNTPTTRGSTRFFATKETRDLYTKKLDALGIVLRSGMLSPKEVVNVCSSSSVVHKDHFVGSKRIVIIRKMRELLDRFDDPSTKNKALINDVSELFTILERTIAENIPISTEFLTEITRHFKEGVRARLFRDYPIFLEAYRGPYPEFSTEWGRAWINLSEEEICCRETSILTPEGGSELDLEKLLNHYRTCLETINSLLNLSAEKALFKREVMKILEGFFELQIQSKDSDELVSIFKVFRILVANFSENFPKTRFEKLYILVHSLINKAVDSADLKAVYGELLKLLKLPGSERFSFDEIRIEIIKSLCHNNFLNPEELAKIVQEIQSPENRSTAIPFVLGLVWRKEQNLSSVLRTIESIQHPDNPIQPDMITRAISDREFFLGIDRRFRYLEPVVDAITEMTPITIILLLTQQVGQVSSLHGHDLSRSVFLEFVFYFDRIEDPHQKSMVGMKIAGLIHLIYKSYSPFYSPSFETWRLYFIRHILMNIPYADEVTYEGVFESFIGILDSFNSYLILTPPTIDLGRFCSEVLKVIEENRKRSCCKFKRRFIQSLFPNFDQKLALYKEIENSDERKLSVVHLLTILSKKKSPLSDRESEVVKQLAMEIQDRFPELLPLVIDLFPWVKKDLKKRQCQIL